MNERDIRFLNVIFPKYYGRIDSAQIDIKQIGRYLHRSGLKEKSPFLAYAITEKSDEEKREDVVSFPELLSRINMTLLSKADSMGIETILQSLDSDKDGFIGIQDVLNMNVELGTMIGEQQVAELMEKITDQGTKISKSELAHIFF